MTYDPLPSKCVRQGGATVSFEEPRKAYKAVSVEKNHEEKRPEDEVVCELLIPPGARVVYPISSESWNNEHLRAEEAYVHEIHADTTIAYSIVHHNFIYREGERVKPDHFDPDRKKVSAPGIHIFATYKGADHW